MKYQMEVTVRNTQPYVELKGRLRLPENLGV